MTTTTPIVARLVNVQKYAVQLKPGDQVIVTRQARGHYPAFRFVATVEIVALEVPGLWSIEYTSHDSGFSPSHGYFTVEGQDMVDTIEITTVGSNA